MSADQAGQRAKEGGERGGERAGGAVGWRAEEGLHGAWAAVAVRLRVQLAFPH